MRSGFDRLAVLVNALPVIALGSVLIITVGRQGTPAALAATPVFFLLYMATSTGLRQTSIRYAGLCPGGFTLGMAAGLAFAGGAWLSELRAGMTTPLALLVSSTPVVCLIPILARLFGYTARTELVTVAVMTFFPSFIYSTADLRKLPSMSSQA